MPRNFQGSFIFGEATSFTGSTSPEQPLLLCKYFDIAVTFSSSYFFRAATFFEQPFFQSSHFFTTVILWELLVFQRKTFTRQLLLENKQFLAQLLLWNSYVFVDGTCSEWRHLQKSYTAWKMSVLGVFSGYVRLNLCIQPKLGEISTRKTPNTGTFYTVLVFWSRYFSTAPTFSE